MRDCIYGHAGICGALSGETDRGGAHRDGGIHPSRISPKPGHEAPAAPGEGVCAGAPASPSISPPSSGTARRWLCSKSSPPSLSWWPPTGVFCPRSCWTALRWGASTSTRRCCPGIGGRPPSTGPFSTEDNETGVTIMHMAAELDAGDIILQASTPHRAPTRTPGQLYARLAELGGHLVVQAVEQLASGTAPRIPPGPGAGHIRPHAGAGALPGGLDAPGSGHSQPGARPAALARRYDGGAHREKL